MPWYLFWQSFDEQCRMVRVKPEIWRFANIYRVIQHYIDRLVAEEIVEILAGFLILFLLIGISYLALNSKIFTKSLTLSSMAL